MNKIFESAKPQQVRLLDSEIRRRFQVNEDLLLRYQSKDLLRSYYFEAGLWKDNSENPKIEHWGWEGPTSEIRGHFVGHWLSAAAITYASDGNRELLGRAEYMLDELERCQKANGGEWIGAIPEKQLRWTEEGRNFGVPLYNLHKIIMGLTDMYVYAGNCKALEIVGHFADWFYRWVKDIPTDRMDIIMETETGGILEEWCRLYEITGEEKYQVLMEKFLRRPLFHALLENKDVLTNMHANTTIPEILGIARMYEVTGNPEYLKAVKNYWSIAVTKRGGFVTGGQTSGEVWIPPFHIRERLGKLNQEHCAVYNMMRLAEFLYQYTGDIEFENYRELNLYNGILAQQNPNTGAAAYYLPMQAGSRKIWSTEKKSFWCCCGSGIQAGASHGMGIYAENKNQIAVNQFIPSVLTSDRWERKVKITQQSGMSAKNVQKLIGINAGSVNYPEAFSVYLNIDASEAPDMTVLVRIPFWNQKDPVLLVNGEQVDYYMENSCIYIPCGSKKLEVSIFFYQALTVHEMSGCSEMIAFRHGPVVLAGMTEKDTIHGERGQIQNMLVHHNERIWGSWTREFRTTQEEVNINFKPLYEVADETYTVYFINENGD